jgi:hypothetical protein
MALRRKVKTEEQKQKDKLINDVIKQIEIDINHNDVTALHEMLKDISNETLTAFLPEEEEKKFGIMMYIVPLMR